MPDKTFKFEIVTPERIVYSEDVTSIIVPGADGYLGVMANHAPMMAELAIGVIEVRDANGMETRIATSGGFMEVAENIVRILADTAELGAEIDVLRAEEARKRAEQRLKTRDRDLNLARAESALKRAINRIRTAGGSTGQ